MTMTSFTVCPWENVSKNTRSFKLSLTRPPAVRTMIASVSKVRKSVQNWRSSYIFIPAVSIPRNCSTGTRGSMQESFRQVSHTKYYTWRALTDEILRERARQLAEIGLRLVLSFCVLSERLSTNEARSFGNIWHTHYAPVFDSSST